jgi:hypothetical protein
MTIWTQDFVLLVSFVLLLAMFMWAKKLPSVEGFDKFLVSLNSRGGNIILLAAASIYFFVHSIKIFYYLLAASTDGHIAQDNAFALMGLQFATSSAFGGAFGALLKTMTGESSKSRSADAPDVATVVTTSTSTTLPPKGEINAPTQP